MVHTRVCGVSWISIKSSFTQHHSPSLTDFVSGNRLQVLIVTNKINFIQILLMKFSFSQTSYSSTTFTQIYHPIFLWEPVKSQVLIHVSNKINIIQVILIKHNFCLCKPLKSAICKNIPLHREKFSTLLLRTFWEVFIVGPHSQATMKHFEGYWSTHRKGTSTAKGCQLIQVSVNYWSNSKIGRCQFSVSWKITIFLTGATSSFNQLGTQHIFLSGSWQYFLVIFPTAVVFRTVGGIYKHSCPWIFIASFALAMLPLRILMRRKKNI